eukprot:TRINITY_DN565_c0_g1_i1.p2 TRINITY_DN565_c0_g1~~TRINITY_DN565_c0_g1_i1.p2  ORF type:complete len:478 (-),score=26.90 TRINITY_DN565_c0_g1_i1:1566-2855(-)
MEPLNPEENSETTLSPKDQKYLEELSAGHLEEIPPEDVKETPPDNKYEHYQKLKYRVDPNEGLIYQDYQLISRQRRMILTLLKQVGKYILQGKSVMSVSFPVYVFEPRSMLELFTTQFAYVPAMLSPLVDISDPLEKMQRVIAWAVASLHLGITQWKPFNPILGETLQGKLGELEVYCEQTSHHPPVCNILLLGKDIKVYGTQNVVAHSYPNSAKADVLGDRCIEVYGKYPTKYRICKNPCGRITGLMFGKRKFKYYGELLVEDQTNGLYGVIKIGNNVKQGFFASFLTKKPNKDDNITGFITKNRELFEKPPEGNPSTKDVLSYCEGSWIDNITFDGEPYWEIEKVPLVDFTRSEEKLPSDSSLRPDIIALEKGNQDEAQKYKDELENLQRHDRKVREPFGGPASKQNHLCNCVYELHQQYQKVLLCY